MNSPKTIDVASAGSVGTKLSRSLDISERITHGLQRRLRVAAEQFQKRVNEATKAMQFAAALPAWPQYAVDCAQRAVLFWDALRQRGNNYLEHVQQGQPPVLHFKHEMVLDARTLQEPVNYALLRIIPPDGVSVDPLRRPYIIIDPRGGHGPGIGGFKDDSQVGVALRAGHPVYFVMFFRDPEPGQTLLHVCAAERAFVHKVRALHPDSPKPAIVGNCQGGWAAMMLAASDPEATGPLVIVGAPMSYWGGAWRDGEGDNPMRYAGGILGGTWLASLSADAGNGKFDGAHLVQNFESLNPANTFVDKYYKVFANVDSEAPRFLEFERWWGGYFLMNREEIEWITRNLFVGNKLWSGEVKSGPGASGAFDLRQIRAPIIMFASLGDNITPPQQAFNWVADVYKSTDEIKARGQVIVGLMQEEVGHLGIFVSGKVAQKEYTQIVSVMKSIELLAPGLYGMEIRERAGEGGRPEYEVEFHELRLEDIVARLNRMQRVDEKPFEAVAAISEFNQRVYELFAQPFVQATSNEFIATMVRRFHPLRVQRWACSDFNPWLAWLPGAAQLVKDNRQALPADHALRRAEASLVDLASATLEYQHALADAFTEALFFHIYGNLFSLYIADREPAPVPQPTDPRELPIVKEALASIDKGGYPEAFARVGFLVTRRGDVPLSRLEAGQQMVKDYKEFLPAVTLEHMRRIAGEQEIIATYETEKAIAALPALLPERKDRERLLTLLERLENDVRVRHDGLTPEQRTMLERVRHALGRPATSINARRVSGRELSP
jgi:pimeloyl-ACP methyl ester carboxylesterase